MLIQSILIWVVWENIKELKGEVHVQGWALSEAVWEIKVWESLTCGG